MVLFTSELKTYWYTAELFCGAQTSGGDQLAGARHQVGGKTGSQCGPGRVTGARNVWAQSVGKWLAIVEELSGMISSLTLSK